MKHIGACFCMLWVLQGCNDEPAGAESYFPLQSGLRWTYRVTTTRGSEQQETHFEQYNAEPESIDGVFHTARITDQGTRYYVRETDEGIYRAAKRTLVALYPQVDNLPHWILKRPLRIGNAWSNPSHPYVLRRLHPYEDNLASGINFKMAYQIKAMNDSVNVPAGLFHNCIRVDGDAQLSIYADARTGYQDIEISTTEWYAPGVGLVKLVREEPLTGDVFTGGKIVFELERFKR